MRILSFFLFVLHRILIVRPKAYNKQRVLLAQLWEIKWTTIECDVPMSWCCCSSLNAMAVAAGRGGSVFGEGESIRHRFITKWQFYILMRSRVHLLAIDCDSSGLQHCLYLRHCCWQFFFFMPSLFKMPYFFPGRIVVVFVFFLLFVKLCARFPIPSFLNRK